MKLRRIIAILIISFANIFILVHAVVPHYHHDGIVCFDAEKSDCQSCADNGSNVDCCKNEGKHHSHLEDCDLPQMVERDGNSIDDSFYNHSSDYVLLACICNLDCYNSLFIHDVELDKYERYDSYISFYTSPFLGSNFGLRAPPTSIIS